MLIPTSQVGVNRGEGLMRTSWCPHGCTSIHSSGWMDVRVDVRACVRVALSPLYPTLRRLSVREKRVWGSTVPDEDGDEEGEEGGGALLAPGSRPPRLGLHRNPHRIVGVNRTTPHMSLKSAGARPPRLGSSAVPTTPVGVNHTTVRTIVMRLSSKRSCKGARLTACGGANC